MPSLPRLLPILLLSFYISEPVHAEELHRTDSILRVGGFLGGGFVDRVGKDANSPGLEQVTKPGIAAALIADLDVSRLFSFKIEPFRLEIQPELAYVTRGSRLERDGEYRGAYTNADYVQIGLLLRAGYSLRSRATPYVLLGPELGILRSAEFVNGLGDTIDVKDGLRSTDIGMILGVGAMYALPPVGSLGLELRADLGLVSIDGQGDGDEIRNAALSLLLVYLY